MRNDARPVGEDSPASPVGGNEQPAADSPTDSRDSVAHDRQSHVVNENAPEDDDATRRWATRNTPRRSADR